MEFEKLKKIIAEVLNVDPDEITMETTFQDDLGAVGLQIVVVGPGIEAQQVPETALRRAGGGAELGQGDLLRGEEGEGGQSLRLGELPGEDYPGELAAVDESREIRGGDLGLVAEIAGPAPAVEEDAAALDREQQVPDLLQPLGDLAVQMPPQKGGGQGRQEVIVEGGPLQSGEEGGLVRRLPPAGGAQGLPQQGTEKASSAVVMPSSP